MGSISSRTSRPLPSLTSWRKQVAMVRGAKTLRQRAGGPLLLLGVGGVLARSFVGMSPAISRAENTRTARALFMSAPTGSEAPIPEAPPADATHFVKGSQMYPPWPAGMEEAMFGMGCFWCSENLYMKMEGVYSTQVGYAGGSIPNPNYQEVCTGASGHNEVVRVVYDPKKISYAELLKVFWERHDPTTANQQGNDRGTQYRSGIYYYTEEQRKIAEETKAAYQKSLEGLRRTPISTEIVPAPEFYYAEDYHQQFDAKPGNRQYCGLRPTGAKLDVPGLAKETEAA